MLTGHLVRTVNRRLFVAAGEVSAAERERLVRTWNIGNAVRLVALTAALAAARRAQSASTR